MIDNSTKNKLYVALSRTKGNLYIVKYNQFKLVENNYFNDPLENIWKQCVFAFCGIEKYYRRMFRIIADSNIEERKEWLAEAESIAEKAVKGII